MVLQLTPQTMVNVTVDQHSNMTVECSVTFPMPSDLREVSPVNALLLIEEMLRVQCSKEAMAAVAFQLLKWRRGGPDACRDVAVAVHDDLFTRPVMHVREEG